MNTLRQQVIEQIKRDHIRPMAPGYFFAWRLFGWVQVALLVILATLVTAFALHIIFEIDWEAFRHTEVSGVRAALMSLPFLWLVLIVVFLTLAVVVMRRTGRGYRYSLWVLLFLFPVASTAAGLAIEHSRFDEPVEKFLLGSLSQQEPWQAILPSVEQQWAQPENGLLGGEVIHVNEETTTFKLEDRKKNEWDVEYQGAAIEQGVKLSPQTQVNVIGTEKETGLFEAAVIKRPKSHRDEDIEHEETRQPSVEARQEKESTEKTQNEKMHEEESEHEDESEVREQEKHDEVDEEESENE